MCTTFVIIEIALYNFTSFKSGNPFEPTSLKPHNLRQFRLFVILVFCYFVILSALFRLCIQTYTKGELRKILWVYKKIHAFEVSATIPYIKAIFVSTNFPASYLCTNRLSIQSELLNKKNVIQ